MHDNHEKTDDAGEGERGFGEFSGAVSGFHLIFSLLNAITLDRVTLKSDRFVQFAISRAATNRLGFAST
jgi:hypothetical protein